MKIAATMTTQDPQIVVDGLWKVFGDQPERVFQPEHASKTRSELQDELGLVTALRDVSFAVEEGMVFVVMGLSGSGKSTLVRCLIRLIEATKGRVFFDGKDISGYSQAQLIEFRRQKTAMVFQHYGLLPHRSVIDNVAVGLEIRGVDKPTRYRMAAETIQTVGLAGWERYRPHEMSGGMQQRVGLARALTVDPDVLLMDEPFSGLDPLIRREMQDELVSLQTELHKTIVFITHDLDEALKLGDRVAIMRDGRIVQQGSPEEIITLPSDDYVTDFVQDVSRAKVMQAKAIMCEPDVVIYERQGPRAALHAMRQHKLDAVFLISRTFILRGVLTRDQAAKLADQRAATLVAAPVDLPVTTPPDAYLADVIPMAAQTEFPVAVVSDNGSLLGEIRRDALLAAVAESGQGT